MCVLGCVQGVVQEMGQDIVPRVEMSGITPSLPLYIFMRVQEQVYILSCTENEVDPGGRKCVGLNW
jgi:hypothetical protein